MVCIYYSISKLDFPDESWRDDMTDYLSEVAQQTENVNIRV